MDWGAAIRIAVGVPWSFAAASRIVGMPVPNLVRGWALIDTGATSNFVDADVLFKRLGLVRCGTVAIADTRGVADFDEVECALSFPKHVGLPPIEAKVIATSMEKTDSLAVLGRTFLQGKALEWDGVGGQAFLRW